MQSKMIDINICVCLTCFRATFVEDYATFWNPMDVTLPPPTTPSPTPSTTPSTTKPSTTPSTTQPSTTTPSTTPSTTQSSTTTPSTTPSTTQSSTTTPSTTSTSDSDSTKPNTAETSMTTQVTITFNLLQGAAIVGMNFDSFLVVVKTELPNILATTLRNRPLSCCLNKVLKILCSLLCAAVEITAVVLFCLADSIKVTLVALVCVAIVLNFIKLVIVCLPIGPSHELKEICDLTVKVCSVIHVIFSTAVVVVGVLEIDNCRNNRKDSWLLKVMVAYAIWIFLFLIWVSVTSIQSKAILGRSQIGSQRHGERGRQQRKMKLSAAEVIVTAVSVILIVGNLCFAVAITVGIFRCQEM
ncbi:probable transcription-associated protein 1 isoform X2 [Sander lucioperca]|uniref:probable transcription-associated protein 1 isoform X2 n=1 Tax=Sander lucioperca TaxID=283035 RepID=UPI001653B123|nr:probable transcription-associated protein 1 isoform X2 [Sander lucioperca]